MLVKFVGKILLVLLTLPILTVTVAANVKNSLALAPDSSWNALIPQNQSEDIQPGESVFVFASKKGGRAAPAGSAVSRVRAEVCSSDYCKQQRSLKNSAPKINLGALAQKSLSLGDELFKSGKYKEAIEAYQKSVKLKPNYTAYFGMGKANFELKQFDAAASAYEQASKLSPQSDDAFYNLGTIRFEQKNYAAALPALEQAVKIAPAESDEYYYYGLTLSELKRRPEAVNALTEAIKLNPKFIDAHNELYNLYVELGRKDEAAKSARRMIEIDPQNSQGFTNLGLVYLKNKKYADALVPLKEAVRLAPKEGQWLLNLAETEYDSQQYAEAILDYQKAIAAKPDFKKIESVMYRFGYANLITGKFAEAVDILTECAALNPKNFYTFFGIATAQMQSQPPNLAATIENLNKAIALEPQKGDAYLLLAVAHATNTPPNTSAALQAAKRASSLAPNSAGTHYILGFVLFQAKLFEAAETEFKEAVRLDPNSGLSWAGLCDVSAILKKFADGLAQCQKAVKLLPPDQVKIARLSLLRIYSIQKRYDQVIVEAQALIKEQPDLADAYLYLGSGYGNTKKYDQAVEALKQAIRLEPEAASFHVTLGEIYWDAGKKEEARREYAVLQTLDPNGAERLKLYMLTEKSKKK